MGTLSIILPPGVADGAASVEVVEAEDEAGLAVALGTLVGTTAVVSRRAGAGTGSADFSGDRCGAAAVGALATGHSSLKFERLSGDCHTTAAASNGTAMRNAIMVTAELRPPRLPAPFFGFWPFGF